MYIYLSISTTYKIAKLKSGVMKRGRGHSKSYDGFDLILPLNDNSLFFLSLSPLVVLLVYPPSLSLSLLPACLPVIHSFIHSVSQSASRSVKSYYRRLSSLDGVFLLEGVVAAAAVSAELARM